MISSISSRGQSQRFFGGMRFLSRIDGNRGGLSQIMFYVLVPQIYDALKNRGGARLWKKEHGIIRFIFFGLVHTLSKYLLRYNTGKWRGCMKRALFCAHNGVSVYAPYLVPMLIARTLRKFRRRKVPYVNTCAAMCHAKSPDESRFTHTVLCINTAGASVISRIEENLRGRKRRNGIHDV